MATLDLVEASMAGVDLDPGDAGLIYIPGVGFRPADGIETFTGKVVNACVIKCHLGYDDLSEDVTTYIPACGGKGGPGKWVGKWTPLFLPEPTTPVYASTLPPVTTCCLIPPPCCSTPWTPPEVPPAVSVAPSILFTVSAVAALTIAKRTLA